MLLMVPELLDGMFTITRLLGSSRGRSVFGAGCPASPDELPQIFRAELTSERDKLLYYYTVHSTLRP